MTVTALDPRYALAGQNQNVGQEFRDIEGFDRSLNVWLAEQ